MRLAPQLEALVQSDPTLSLRRIEIPGWNAAVVKQYHVTSLPHLLLYEDGRQVASGTRRVLEALRK